MRHNQRINSRQVLTKWILLAGGTALAALFALALGVAPALAKSRDTSHPTAKLIFAPPNEAERKVFNSYVLDSIVRSYTLAVDRDVFDRLFIAHLPEPTQSEAREFFKGIKELPRLERRENQLVLSDGAGGELRFERSDLSKLDFKVNGIQFTYSTRQSLRWNIDFVVRKLELSQKGRSKDSFASHLLELFLPEAHAGLKDGILKYGGMVGTGIVTFAIGFVSNKSVTGLWDASVEKYCKKQFEEEKKDISKEGKCEEYIKKQEELEEAQYPLLDAVANQIASDQGNVLTMFDVIEYACPDKNDGQDRIYEAKTRRHRDTSGNPSDWYTIRAVTDSKGIPKTVILFPNEVDPNSPDAEKKAFARYSFNAKKRMTKVEIPNPNYDSKDPYSPETIELSHKNVLSPEEEKRLKDLKDTVAFINYRINRCVARAVDIKKEQGIDPGSPAKPVQPNKRASAPAKKADSTHVVK